MPFLSEKQTPTVSPRHPLNPIESDPIFSRWHVDVLGPLPESHISYKYILLFVESLSRWPEAFPLKTQTASEIFDLFYHQICCRYGFPQFLVSDQGRAFMSTLMQQLCKTFKISKIYTSTYHPASNSTTERYNKTLEQMLRHYITPSQTSWPDYLQSCMLALRTTPAIRSTGFSPFDLLFGTHCPLPVDNNLLTPTTPTTVQDRMASILKSHTFARNLAKINIRDSQQTQKEYYDKKASSYPYFLGQKVWLLNHRRYPHRNPKLQA